MPWTAKDELRLFWENFRAGVYMGLGVIIMVLISIVLSSIRAPAVDLSSLQQTPVRLVAMDRREPEAKPFTPPPCVGIVWPVRMARCEVTVRF